MATAYLLDDAPLKRKAQEYIEWIISSARLRITEFPLIIDKQ